MNVLRFKLVFILVAIWSMPLVAQMTVKNTSGVVLMQAETVSGETEVTISPGPETGNLITDTITIIEGAGSGKVLKATNSSGDASWGTDQGVGSLDGVSHDGGNIDLVAGDNISIDSDNAGNQITVSSALSSRVSKWYGAELSETDNPKSSWTGVPDMQSTIVKAGTYLVTCTMYIQINGGYLVDFRFHRDKGTPEYMGAVYSKFPDGGLGSFSATYISTFEANTTVRLGYTSADLNPAVSGDGFLIAPWGLYYHMIRIDD